MRWRQARKSDNIEDLRDGGRRGGLTKGRVLGIGGVGIVVALVATLLGADVRQVLGLIGAVERSAGDRRGSAPRSATKGTPKDEQGAFVAAVLGDTEDTWKGLFRRQGRRYQEPRLVLFRRRVSSACGSASAAIGPFYCPGDRKVYLDLSFFEELSQRFGAPGDFARAYVIAHEVGHHVQRLLGTSTRVQRQQRRLSKAEGNKLSVRLELQADCYAGVWAHHAERARKLLEAGDLDEALKAAAAIGDDRLQRQAGGEVVPDSFTHGTSAQRQRWFRKGFASGALDACDTFGGPV